MFNALRAACLGLALLGADAAAADVPVRTHVDDVAHAIEANYFDAVRGKQIASGLRGAASSGAFDKLTDDRDLATTLTDRLKPIDRHFAVTWSPDAAPQPRARERRGPPQDDPQRRSNYGIRRVEVQPGNIGYIDLRAFADFEFGKPDQPARQAIEAALQLVSAADALIIDLRNNGGGSPAMVGYLSSAFTPKGADIYNTFHYRDGTASEAPTDWYAKPRLDTPLYVLINARTGSAAEAFAYTMKNAGRATVVGEASAGAANPGDFVDAGHGFRVFVSTGSPVNPISKKNWEGDGVAPDVAVASAAAFDAAKALALESVLKQDRPESGKTDARWALEALRAEAAPPTGVRLEDYVGSYGALLVGQDDGHLFLRRGRRPPTMLQPLGNDVFAAVAESGTRVEFERGGDHRVAAFEMKSSDGLSSRHRRDE